MGLILFVPKKPVLLNKSKMKKVEVYVVVNFYKNFIIDC